MTAEWTNLIAALCAGIIAGAGVGTGGVALFLKGFRAGSPHTGAPGGAAARTDGKRNGSPQGPDLAGQLRAMFADPGVPQGGAGEEEGGK